MFVKFHKTGKLGIMSSSSQLLSVFFYPLPYCLTQKQPAPNHPTSVVSKPSRTLQQEALAAFSFFFFLTDEETGLPGFPGLSPNCKANPKQIWDWNVCLPLTQQLSFLCLLHSLSARRPHRTVWPQKRQSFFKMWLLSQEKSLRKVNLKMSKFKPLQNLSYSRLERKGEDRL